jgi:hypothetical protein
MVMGPFSDTHDTLSAALAQIGTSKIWSHDFGVLLPHHGLAPITLTITCPSGPPPTIESFDIYVDPSGTVVDSCTKQPISGATVTLLKQFPPLPPGGGSFITPSPSDSIPTTNPQTTGADGAFGWDVIPGTWEVQASKAGYVTSTTSPLSIPPSVTGLQISLTPTAGCETIPPTVAITSPADGSTIDHLTSISGTASDDTFVSSVTVSIDGATPQTATYSAGSWTLAVSLANGPHTAVATATDSVGLTTTTPVTHFTIGLQPTKGEVSGHGKIGKGTHFELDAESKDGKTFKGHLDFTDKSGHIDLDGKTITLLTVDDTFTTATINGDGKVGDDTPVTFQVVVTDPETKGSSDTFSIKIIDSTGSTIYQNSGNVKGHIEIENEKDKHHGDEKDNDDKHHGDEKGNDDNHHNDDKISAGEPPNEQNDVNS